MTGDLQRDPTLDGPIAAPDHHRVLFENDRVRVVETVIRVGDTTPLHTHLAPHLLIFSSGSRFVRRDADGAVMFDTRLQGPDFVIPAHSWNDGTGPHTLENVGSDDIMATAIELKP
jgi:hypothetical protein